jgi:hypothetical protein
MRQGEGLGCQRAARRIRGLERSGRVVKSVGCPLVLLAQDNLIGKWRMGFAAPQTYDLKDKPRGS